MAPLKQKLKRSRLLHSKTALAVPVTFLILLVSTLSIISFTYYFSVQRVQAQNAILKESTAKETMLSLSSAVLSTLWQPGSQATCEISDSGGVALIQPSINALTVNVTGGQEITDTLFNTSVGKITYELLQGGGNPGLYLKGDSRAITNQSGASMAQLYLERGPLYLQIALQYRPSVTYVASGIEDGKPVTNIRLYIVNLNSSESITSQGMVPLQICCKTTQITTNTYHVSSAVDHLDVASNFNGTQNNVSVPIQTTIQGAIIHVDTVVSDISIQRCLH